MLERRGLLTGLLMTPAIVRHANLMMLARPVKRTRAFGSMVCTIQHTEDGNFIVTNVEWVPAPRFPPFGQNFPWPVQDITS